MIANNVNNSFAFNSQSNGLQQGPWLNNCQTNFNHHQPFDSTNHNQAAMYISPVLNNSNYQFGVSNHTFQPFSGNPSAMASPQINPPHHQQLIQNTTPPFTLPQQTFIHNNLNNFVQSQQSPNIFQFNHTAPAGLPTPDNFILPTQPNRKIASNKRNSFELDDDLCAQENEQPPTKQLLSERKLYKKFGSLQLNQTNLQTIGAASLSASSSDSDDSLDEDRSMNGVSDLSQYVCSIINNREQVPIKDFPKSSDTPLERLAREERDKLSKALVLYQPPPSYNYTVSHDDDEEEIDRVWRRNERSRNSEPSVIITDVTYDDEDLLEDNDLMME